MFFFLPLPSCQLLNFFHLLNFFTFPYSLMSAKIINNLQSQLKIYQQMFEQLENDSESPTTSTPINDISRLMVAYIKAKKLLKIFNITKVEYNNILIRINIY